MGKVAAHETGHFLGNFEDYGISSNGRRIGAGDYGPGVYITDANSVMGVNIGKASERHFWRIKELLSQNLSGAELIKIDKK